MSNILKAFVNIVNNYQVEINNVTDGNNRANNMGEGLEVYIKNAFIGTFESDDAQERLEYLRDIFSYQGNKNNPPDLILKNSDAIEIKKIESKNSAIALNSSYPKAKLYADSPMLTKACKACEEWDEKDMLYAIGHLPKKSKRLKSLWLVYGDCFCAEKESYEKIKSTISDGISAIPDMVFTKTNELGKVNRIDPLGITNLRIRGMWHIENPNKIFDYVYEYDERKEFQLICLMRKEKYDTFSNRDKEMVKDIESNDLEIKEIKIKNPNNPIQLLDAVLLVFKANV